MYTYIYINIQIYANVYMYIQLLHYFSKSDNKSNYHHLIYSYICTYKYIYIDTCIRTYIYIYIYIYICVYIYTYMYVLVCMYVCMQVHVPDHTLTLITASEPHFVGLDFFTDVVAHSTQTQPIHHYRRRNREFLQVCRMSLKPILTFRLTSIFVPIL